MRTIAVVNQKGGVGKTTATVNLGHALALQGLRVMVADMDPQGHLAACFGVHRPPARGINGVLRREHTLTEAAQEVRKGLLLVAGGSDMADWDAHGPDRADAFLLRDALQANRPEVDILLLDCPPSSGMVAVNALTAADDALVPVAGDYLSLTGVARLMLTFKRLEPLMGRDLGKWVFMSRFMPRRRLAREVRAKLLQHFPSQLLRTPVGEAAVLAECAGVGRTIFEYRPRSQSAVEFEQLAGDLQFSRLARDEQENRSHVA